MEYVEIDIPSVQTHEKIPSRVKSDVALLSNEKDMSITFFLQNSKTCPYRIKVSKGFTVIFDIPMEYPFRAPTITLEEYSGFAQSFNNKLPSLWAPSIRLVRLFDMVGTHISLEKERLSALEDIKNGNVNTLDEIKKTYLVPYEFGGKYPEFQKERHGLWVHGRELGYLLFYVRGDSVHFVYQPKSRNCAPTESKSSYALGCYKDNEKKYELSFIEEGRMGKIHNCYLSFRNDNTMAMIFSQLNEESIVYRIIPYGIGRSFEFVML